MPAILVPAGITVPAGFTLEAIARVDGARELAIAPNGDLFAGTSGPKVVLIRDPEGEAQPPRTVVTIREAPDAGVSVGDGALFVGTTYGVWRVPLSGEHGDQVGKPVKIATVRPDGGNGHATTSVAVAGKHVYLSVGSSCNACTESDPTRATVQEVGPDGGPLQLRAAHIRNAIALAIDPATGALWAGVAGQDELERGHPYEIFDPVTLHHGVADYGWPQCYDNHKAALGGSDCSRQTVSRVVFPAYETPIGATFYPLQGRGRYAFPSSYRGGAFVALHGSWHQPPVPPRVVFVAIHNDEPVRPVDWNDPAAQWREFVGGFQRGDGSRGGRPTGVTVGTEGSLFVADDAAGLIYRIRPKH